MARWFGQGGEQLGEDQETQKANQVLVGGMVSRVENSARGAGIAAGSGGKDRLPNGGNDTTGSTQQQSQAQQGTQQGGGSQDTSGR